MIGLASNGRPTARRNAVFASMFTDSQRQNGQNQYQSDEQVCDVPVEHTGLGITQFFGAETWVPCTTPRLIAFKAKAVRSQFFRPVNAFPTPCQTFTLPPGQQPQTDDQQGDQRDRRSQHFQQNFVSGMGCDFMSRQTFRKQAGKGPASSQVVMVPSANGASATFMAVPASWACSSVRA